MSPVRSWEELLDRLEEELEGATPCEPFVPPVGLGPAPTHLVARAVRLQQGLADAEREILAAMVTTRQEIALLSVPLDDHSRFIDTQV